MQANTFANVDTLIQKVTENIQEPLPPDFNYSYINSGPPGMYTILKRSTETPLEAKPVLTVMIAQDYKFMTKEDILSGICEMYAKREFEWRKQQNSAESGGSGKLRIQDNE